MIFLVTMALIILHANGIIIPTIVWGFLVIYWICSLLKAWDDTQNKKK